MLSRTDVFISDIPGLVFLFILRSLDSSHCPSKEAISSVILFGGQSFLNHEGLICNSSSLVFEICFDRLWKIVAHFWSNF